MQIKLFNMRSESNSLYKYTSDGVRVDQATGTVKEGTPVLPMDVLHPTVRIAIAGTPTFNYAYIDSTARYYFITKKVCETNGIWLFTFSVDPLMTYNGVIQTQTGFVERSENNPNPLLPNAVLTAKTGIKTNTVNGTSGGLDSGHWMTYDDYIHSTSANQLPHLMLGINATAINYSGITGTAPRPAKSGIVYVYTNLQGYFGLVMTLQSAQKWGVSGLTLEDVIKEYYFMPVAPDWGTLKKLTALKFSRNFVQNFLGDLLGWDLFDTDFASQGDYWVVNGELDYSYNTTFQIAVSPVNPNSNSFFVNSNPYTNWILQFNPFPAVSLNPAEFIKSSSEMYNVGVIIESDIVSGDANMYVYPRDGLSSQIPYKRLVASANLKKPLPIFSLASANIAENIFSLTALKGNGTQTEGITTKTVTYNDESMQFLNNTETTSKEAASTGGLSMWTQAVGAGFSLASGLASASNVVPAIGSTLYDAVPRIITQYQEYTDDGHELYGYPCMRTMTLSTSNLSGFTKVTSLHLFGLTTALPEEKTLIENFFSSGVLYP